MFDLRFRAVPGATKKAIFLICLAVGVVGISYGSLAIAYGFPLWLPVVSSIVVLAGASEFMFIAIIASGGSPFAAALAGLLVNARHFPFGVAVREFVGTRASSYIGCHIMNDESVVVGISQENIVQRRAAYWACGLGIAFCWPVSVLAGAWLGRFIPDTQAMGLDAVFPAILIALIFPALQKRRVAIPASVGAAVGLITVPFLPAGMPVLCAMAGMLAWRGDK